MQKLTSIISVTSVLLFSAAVFSFTHVYGKYTDATTRNSQIEEHYQKLLQRKAQLENMRVYANQATKVNTALEKLGYTAEQWSKYQVSLDKGLSFKDLNYILAQAKHGKNYYFVPEMLDITLPDKEQDKDKKDKKSKIDAHFVLQGHYLVKQ